MTQPLLRKDLVLMLTATIDPGATPMVTRVDPLLRLKDYQEALEAWLQSGISQIVFVENSGYDLSTLRKIATSRADVRIDFISLSSNALASKRGKGFGELTMIEAAFRESETLRKAGHVVKCTGRLTLINIADLLRRIEDARADIFCTLKDNLTFADSRFFIARPSIYLDQLVPRKDSLDDSAGVYFEHVLARAAAEAVSKGLRWQCFPAFPYIAGVSGTFGTRMTDRPWIRLTKVLYNYLRRYVYEH